MDLAFIHKLKSSLKLKSMSSRSIEDSLQPRKRSRKSVLLPKYDHISSLHESVLCHILSRLPTKDAVQTSILSKDWKYKWSCVYNVEILDFLPGGSCEKESFVNFVDRVVFFARNLESFCLTCYGSYGLSRVKGWICDILSRDIVRFEVSYWVLCEVERVVLPWSLLHKSSLKTLKLVFQCTISIAVKSSFPSLKKLYLCKIQFLNENSGSDTLILDFPVLESLKLIRCEWVSFKIVKICAPILITFLSSTKSMDEPHAYSIHIISSRVSTFKCLGGFPENIILTGSSIISASLVNGDPFGYRLPIEIGTQVQKLFDEFSKLSELELSYFFLKANDAWKKVFTVQEPLEKALQLGPPLRQLDKLKRLWLVNLVNAEELFVFLHAAPSLKFLSVNVFKCDEYDYDAVEHVPSCIIFHLEEVEFKGLTGLPHEYNLVKFLLKNGKVLEKVSIFGYFYREVKKIVNQIAEKLSGFPRVSTSLTIACKDRWQSTDIVF